MATVTKAHAPLRAKLGTKKPAKKTPPKDQGVFARINAVSIEVDRIMPDPDQPRRRHGHADVSVQL